MLVTIGLILIIAYFAYKWGTSTFDFFENQGIKYVKPYPFIGTSKWLFMRENIITITKEYYDQFPSEKVFGLFNMRAPFHVVRDPELIKQLVIKEFEHFPHHMDFINVEHDEISNSMLAMLRGKKWKQMRSALSPAFTGSKMRAMFEFITKVGENMSKYFLEKHEKEGLVPIDIKDLFSRYTNDVIATCAFGIECDSFHNPSNEFFRIGQEFNRFTKPGKIMKIMFSLFFPKIAKALGLEILPRELRVLFNELIVENMKKREKDNIYRPDMIHLLMQLKKNELKTSNETEAEEIRAAGVVESVPAKTTWTDNELIAQCYMFFQAGFETSSSTLRFIAYLLATNPGSQEKLLEEIDQLTESLEGKTVTYDQIQTLKYMEMVILESLRVWPPLFVTERECVNGFAYKDENGLQFMVSKGSFIWIPIHALHLDEKYFPNPETFMPERFGDDSNQRNSSAYMPFGVGPRSCIANRFAMMEMKAALYYLLKEFTFEVCPETEIPIKLKKTMVGLVLEKEIKLYLKPRLKN